MLALKDITARVRAPANRRPWNAIGDMNDVISNMRVIGHGGTDVGTLETQNESMGDAMGALGSSLA